MILAVGKEVQVIGAVDLKLELVMDFKSKN